jgi:hypothetical protein
VFAQARREGALIMALVIEFGLYGFGKKTGTLKAAGLVPITMIKCGIVMVVRFKHEHLMEFQEYIAANVALDEFLVARAPAVRDAKKRATARARRQADERAAQMIEFWRQSSREANERFSEASQRAMQLEQALRTMAALAKEAP